MPSPNLTCVKVTRICPGIRNVPMCHDRIHCVKVRELSPLHHFGLEYFTLDKRYVVIFRMCRENAHVFFLLTIELGGIHRFPRWFIRYRIISLHQMPVPVGMPLFENRLYHPGCKTVVSTYQTSALSRHGCQHVRFDPVRIIILHPVVFDGLRCLQVVNYPQVRTVCAFTKPANLLLRTERLANKAVHRYEVSLFPISRIILLAKVVFQKFVCLEFRT